jgi:hypothetical protein
VEVEVVTRSSSVSDRSRLQLQLRSQSRLHFLAQLRLHVAHVDAEQLQEDIKLVITRVIKHKKTPDAVDIARILSVSSIYFI